MTHWTCERNYPYICRYEFTNESGICPDCGYHNDDDDYEDENED